MTGFGRGCSGDEEQGVTAEIRSINHRYRDIVIRMPRALQVYEDDARGLVGAGISRGRIEVSVSMAGNGQEGPCDVEVNIGLLRAYIRALNRMREEAGVKESLDLATICSFKDVMVARPREPDLERVKGALTDAVLKALENLEVMRRAEGARLEEDLSGRLSVIEGAVDRVEARIAETAGEHLRRLREHLQRLVRDVALDEQRLLQEVAILADRSDVSEEIVRIKSHLRQFRDYLALDEPVGRRLDFLLQELHREINTLGVKASDVVVSKASVEIKAELEKIREQVQNIE